MIIFLLFNLLSFTDETLGFSIDPPPSYQQGFYSDTEGVTWTSVDGKCELRIIIVPVEAGQDPSALMDTIIAEVGIKTQDRVYLDKPKLEYAHADAGMWTDVTGGSGSKRIRGRMYIIVSKEKVLIAMAVTPLVAWEGFESMLMKSLSSLKFIGNN